MERFRIGLEEARSLSSERRLLILALISDGLRTRRALIGKLDITGPSLSRHIDVLKRTGLVTVSKERNSNFKVENRYALTKRGESLLVHIDFKSQIDKNTAYIGNRQTDTRHLSILHQSTRPPVVRHKPTQTNLQPRGA